MANRTCMAEACAKAHYSKGYCMPHYRKWKRYGDPFGERQYPKTYCKVAGCDRRAAGWKMCDAHYRRWRKSGDPLADGDLGVVYRDWEEAFDAYAVRDGASGCLIWTGNVGTDGYGAIGGYGTRAHRYAWEQVHGPIPEGIEIDHICHRKTCVEVTHLRMATRLSNSWNLSGATQRSSTGARNVFYARGKYRVRVVRDGARHNGGTFPTIEEAALAAEKLRAELFGEFAGRG